jgi:uncharacterized small protein (DUF1192 family)
VQPEELHHHDIVHFALNEVQEEIGAGKEQDVIERLKAHLRGNKDRRAAPEEVKS